MQKKKMYIWQLVRHYWDNIKKKMLQYTESSVAEPILYTIAFTEAFIFPIPPDVLLITMVLLQEKKAWRYALVCTVFSVLGGIVGYSIGAFAMQFVGDHIVRIYNLESIYTNTIQWFQQYGIVAVLIAGFTPIPYKLCTVICGVLHFSLPLFIVSSCIARGMRFFLLATLPLYRTTKMGRYLERHSILLFCAILIVCGILFFL